MNPNIKIGFYFMFGTELYFLEFCSYKHFPVMIYLPLTKKQ